MSCQVIVGVLLMLAVGAAATVYATRWWFWRQYIKPAQEENRRLRAKVAQEIEQGTRIVRRPRPH